VISGNAAKFQDEIAPQISRLKFGLVKLQLCPPLSSFYWVQNLTNNCPRIIIY